MPRTRETPPRAIRKRILAALLGKRAILIAAIRTGGR